MNNEKLRTLRLKMGLTQEQLARDIGVSIRTYARYESTGPSRPVLMLVQHMADKHLPSAPENPA